MFSIIFIEKRKYCYWISGLYLHFSNKNNHLPYCKLVIFGTLTMPTYGHEKRWYQLRKLWCFPPRQNSNLSLTHLILKILLKYYKLFILCTLRITRYTPQKIASICMKFLCWYCRNPTWSLTSFLRYHTLRNSAIWLIRSILTDSLRTRILPNKYA